VLGILRHNWFLVALAALFAVGFFAHETLQPLADQNWIRTCTVALAMFLMALPLQASDIWAALRRPWATLLAVVVTFGLLPLIAWGASFGLAPEFKGGLLVAAVTPCTMASATVWTRKAGGNDTAATVVTVVTNLICFLVTPAWMYVMTGQQTKQSLGDVGSMVLQLLLTVVLPVVVAQVLRTRPIVAEFAARRKAALGLTSQWCILLMVLIGAIKTGEKLSGTELHATALLELIAMIAAVLFVHVTSFWLGYFLAKLLGLRWGDQVAVAFAGSQKTLMVGMNVSIGANFSVLPMVTYHIGQLFIDTVLADWLKKRQPEEPNAPARDKR
jgi:sodium/bile acid cotransporter 7